MEKIITIPAADFVRGRGYVDADPHQLSQAIQELVPSGIWRNGMETTIANRLNLPVLVIIQVVTDLINRGELTRPPDEELRQGAVRARRPGPLTLKLPDAPLPQSDS